MPLGRTDLFLDEIEVVEQPFSGRCDPAVRLDSLDEQAVNSNQNIFVLCQAREKPARRPFRT